ncbi:MAG: hypothetical protein DHS20C02_15450 [Micavibrio sp.]|nr:MAG: hypothetical protein DHS20C02_15450 [Micavibrio sp.]
MSNTLLAPKVKQSTKKPRIPVQKKPGTLHHMKRLSYGTKNTGNKIIQGDNLAILEALELQVQGQVRCVYIDPPYNNKDRYTHYDDKLCHVEWLEALEKCATSLRRTLREDGSMWVSIDDNEMHYLKVVLDKVFGRENFVSTIVWQQRTTRENRKILSNDHEYILVYAKNYSEFKKTRNLLPMGEEVISRYKNPDNDPRGPWQSVSANVQAGHAVPSQFYEIVAPNGKKHSPPKGRCWAYSKDKMNKEIAIGNIWFGKEGNGVPRLKKFLSESKRGVTPKTLWTADEVSTNDLAKKHIMKLLPDHQLFDTPKPEPLLHRIIEIASDPGDLILDAYLGSGTTAAVAHKMARQYIGIEVGDHAASHCTARLKKVIEGDCYGLADRLQWKGGGGFDFFMHKQTAIRPS